MRRKVRQISSLDWFMDWRLILTDEEKRELEAKATTGLTDQDKELLLRSHLPLIFKCVRKWHRSCAYMELEDLVHEGIRIVYSMMDKYRPERGRFTTFVTMLLHTTGCRFIATNMYRIGTRIPDPVLAWSSKLYRVDAGWHTSSARAIAAAQKIGAPISQVVPLQVMSDSLSKTRDIRRGNSNGKRGDYVAVDNSSNGNPAHLESIRALFIKRLDIVLYQKHHKEVILGRFEGKTLADIGRELSISRERVRQIEEVAIETIKVSDAFNDIKDLWELYLGESRHVQTTNSDVVVNAYVPSSRGMPSPGRIKSSYAVA